MGDLSSSLSSYQKALEIQQKSLLPNHPSFVALHGKMATVLEELGRYVQALQHAENALEIANKACGPSHPETQKRQNYRDISPAKSLSFSLLYSEEINVQRLCMWKYFAMTYLFHSFLV